MRLPFGIGVITTTFPAQFCSCVFSFPPHPFLPPLHLPNARATAGGQCWARIGTLGSQGGAISELCSTAKTVLFTDTREEPRTEDSSHSGFLRRGALTAGAAVETVSENSTHWGSQLLTCVHPCTGQVPSLPARFTPSYPHREKLLCKNVIPNGIFPHFETVIWGNVLEICIFSPFVFFFLSSDFAKLLNFTIMYIGFTLGNYAIMDYSKFPILFICVCF